jgi:hypothetical protein
MQFQQHFNQVMAHAIKGNLVSKKSNSRRCKRDGKKVYLGPSGGFYYICKGRKVYIKNGALKAQLAQTGAIHHDKAVRKDAKLELLDYGVPKAKLRRMNLSEMLYTLADLRSSDQ